ncbi:MAG: hypothetical protein INR63_28725 [Actinomycetospora chiangmaiensis]|nr:hypothetical protein [Actinomycetospora chiangmaiensis]
MVPVSPPATAAAVKLTGTMVRAVNVALATELTVVISAMDVDVWEAIEGARSKPFGFTPFDPGPSLNGHCIPIDPFCLSPPTTTPSTTRAWSRNPRIVEA